MFQGTITAMVTPFREGRLDEAALRDQVEFQIGSGIDGLSPAGTTGEAPTLSGAEHARLIELTIQFAHGRVPVIPGVGSNSTSHAIELHSLAKRLGATAALSVTPYYNRPTQEGMFRHFLALADAVELPIVLYNVPSRTGTNLLPATVARLSTHKHIVAIKEAGGAVDQAAEIMSRCEITVLSGDDALTLPMISIGAQGVVSVASNLVPKEMVAMTRRALAGEFGPAREIHRRLAPLIRSLFLDGNPAGIKCAMSLAARDSGELRLPLCGVSESTRA
ncbi:MAG: 4-hydroxy-tetrahydrodipicolinate synthase, partial [Tepidisphaeraceae bacterium]